LRARRPCDDQVQGEAVNNYLKEGASKRPGSKGGLAGTHGRAGEDRGTPALSEGAGGIVAEGRAGVC